MLGMQWHQVHEEACRLEHYISGAVEARVVASLGQPTTCPHGNPIPGYVPSARTYLRDQGAVRLLTVTPGMDVRLLCVSEVVEDEEEMISYLHDRGLTPGTRLTLRAVSAGDSSERSVTLELRGQPIEVTAHVAYALWVVPAADAA
jgi:DtxR family Mn-dependent transcriptional regulator